MRRRTTFNLLVIVALLLSAVPLPAMAAPAPAVSNPAPAQVPNQQPPIVSQPVSPAKTNGLPAAPTVTSVPESKGFNPDRPYNRPLSRASGPANPTGDAALQNQPGVVNMPAPIVNFEALNNISGYYPPDTNGDVGPNHYVQMVNVSTAVYNKSGTLLYGPFFPHALWPTGDVCNGPDDGDPVVIYDQLADRWLLSQFALPNYPNGPFYECIAVSKTGTPTNLPSDWYPYTFLVSSTKMDDYPKISVWPDGYYMTANEFTAGAGAWAGVGVWAFDRAKMLNGQPATFQYFDVGAVTTNFGGMLPADLDGSTPPPAGSPAYFFEVDDNVYVPALGADAMRIWKFHVDWTTPANTTFGLASQPNTVLPVASFDFLPCSVIDARNCIPQQGSSQKLDAIGDRLMFRATYRNFSDHEAVMLNHTVLADGTDRAGVRWYEVRNPSTTPTIYQQGTYAPADGQYRWMGSIAMDHVGNVALGYSVASSTLYPSIRYAGRLSTDPAGTLPQAEASIITGSGAQTGTGARWGDYSDMTVDPIDDCTFWYTQEYIQTTGTASWQTRVASFKFPNCALGPQGTLTGVVTNTATSAPIVGAVVQATATITQNGTTSTAAGGTYSMLLLTGSYTVTASAFGFLPKTMSGVAISQNTTTTLNIGLDPAPTYVVSGTVKDATAGWPLYAKIDIAGYPGGPIWTNPATGFYSVTLPSAITYQFNVTAFSAGYNAASQSVGPLSGNTTVNIGLTADAVACVAPGYTLAVTGLLEQFSSNALPAGWAVTSSGTCPWTFNDPGARTNLTGGSGGFAIADSDICGSGTTMSTTLTSAAMNVSSLANVNLSFNYDYNNLATTEVAAVDVSADNGTTWSNVVTWNTDQRGPALFSQDVTSLLSGATQAKLRFRYVAPGWDWWWEVDNAFVGEKKCLPNAGGLVVGDVKDANTAAGLSGVAVSSPTSAVTTNANGFYTLFSPAGSKPITASLANYKTEVATVTVPLSGTVRQDFLLGAGKLNVAPAAITVSLSAGLSTTVPMTLTNSGNLAAAFSLIELDKGGVPYGPFEKPTFVVKPFRQDAWKDAIGLGIPKPPPFAPYAAGDVIQSWVPTGVTGPWGVAYDGNNGTVWVSSPSAAWLGVNKIFEFTPAGTATGRSYAYNWNPSNGPADVTYNWNTGMLWVMNVASPDNCIYEVNPASGPTGNKICPTGASGFAVSQRGLAYDPSTDTYFAGSWNDSMVYQFKADGTLLNSKNVGLAVAGLAYNPTTQHLFVVDSAAASKFYVLDTANNYAQIGSFTATGFTGGAGLEIDCDGNLWAVEQTAGKVFQIKTGEAASFCTSDVEWLSTSPVTGTVAAGAVQPVNVTVNSAAVQPGIYNAQIKVKHNTPYNVPNVPVKMTVTAPATWGKITGNVSTQGYCDANPAALVGVTVTVQSASTAWNLVTDATGQYNYWLDQTYSPLTITANIPGYQFAQVTGVNVVGQATTTNDFSLRWLQPCLTINPSAIVATLSLGQSTTRPFRLTNAGAVSTVYSMTEQNVSAPAAPIAKPIGDINRLPAYHDPGIPIPYVPQVDLIQDGSFEATSPTTYQNPYWTQGSTAFGTVLCDAAGCGTGGGTAGPRTGSFWAWFGGSATGDTGYLQQTVTTGGPSTLQFYLWIGTSSGGASDYLKVSVDGTEIFRATGAQIGSYGAYTLVTVPVNVGASSHVLRFDGVTVGSGNFNLDDVSLTGGAGAAQDVPWLSEIPVTGTVAADSFLNTTIGFDANAVAVPGAYKANVNVNSLDPRNPTRTANMTMNVTAPASWGVLTGTVNSQGYCDANLAPLAGATVVLQAANGLTRTVTTGANGGYTLWLNSLTNPYTLTVTAAQHIGSVPVGGITVDQLGAITVAPTIALRSIQPCVDYTPASLSVTVPWQGSASQTLTISNTGAATTAFTTTEENGPFTPLALINAVLVVNDGGSNASATQAFTTALTNLGYAYVVTTSSLATGIAATLSNYLAVIYAGVPSSGAEQTQVTAYLDAGGKLIVADNDLGFSIGASALYGTYLQATYGTDSGSKGAITGVDIMAGINTDLSLDPFPDNFTINGADAVGIFQNTSPRTGLAGLRIRRNLYKAIYFAWDFQNVGTTTIGEAIETTILQKAMEWMIGVNVPWVSESPTTGNIAADGGVQNVTVTFNANVPQVTQPGTYRASLVFETDDAVKKLFSVPVTMTVVPTSTQGKLNGTVTSLGYCDVNPAPVNAANLIVQNNLGVTHTLTTDAAGYYQEWLDAVFSPYTVTASAPNHLPGTATGIVTGGLTTTLNLNLRWLTPCVGFTPSAGLSANLTMGMSTTLPMTISNSGAFSLTFSLKEADRGFTPLGPQAVDVLVVNDGSTSATQAFTTALTNLGYTYYVTASSSTTGVPVNLLDYKYVIWAGSPSTGAEANQLIAYLDVGGSALIADNDFGFFMGGTPLYATYLEAVYGADSGSDGVINGQDIMAGITTDISSDPFPDNFTISGTHAVGIFANTAPRTGLAGLRIQRNAYKAIMFAWDFNYTGGTSITATVKTDVLQRAMNWLKPTDLLWLSEDVTNGTVAPNSGAQVVNVTFDAGAADVTQPGTYMGSIIAVSNDPVNGGATYPVTMTVSAPATWGKLTGIINGLAACDVNPAPLANADVLVQGATMSWTLKTNASGAYQVWAVAQTPITVTASQSGFVSQSVTGVSLTAGVTTTQNLNLRAILPCAGTNVPSPLVTTQSVNQIVTRTMTISNTGAGGLIWNFTERVPAFRSYAVLQPGTTDRADRYHSVTTHTPVAPLVEAIQDGSFEATSGSTYLNPYWDQYSATYGTVFCDAAGCGTGGGTAGPRTGSFWAWFGGSGTGDVGYISQTLVLTPGVTTLNFYLWIGTSAGGASDYIKASIDGTPVFTATGANIGNYSTYTLVSVNISQFATGGAHSLRFDSTTVGSGNFNVDDVSVDISGLPSGSCSPNALPWVSAVPVSGTTVADGSSSVNVVFNSTGIAPGSYSGFLCLNTNDATHAKIEIPVATTIGADLTLVYHDLEDIVHTGETLFVGGDFNGWNATATQMTANADNSVFTATVPVTLTSVQLKYIVYTDTLHSGPANWNWLQSNNRVVTMTGNTTVDHYRNIEPGYYVLQWPYATSTVVGVPTENIFGQVWADDLTARSGAPRGLAAELGYGMASDAALWAWQTMGWSSQAGNNDEFVSSIVPTATGVYSYAVRYNGNWGVGNPHNTWYYGDKNWGTPFSTTEAGVLTVTDRRGVTLSPATNMLPGKVGSVVTHTLHITNTGSTTDTFDLTVTGNTWAVNLSATSLTLGAGQGATVYAYVNIPADVKTSDTATVKAVSQADATKQATAVLTTAVKYFIYYWPVIRR